jgi:hypothetical protein
VQDFHGAVLSEFREFVSFDAGYVCSAQVDIAQVGAAQIGAGEIGTEKIGTGQIGTREISTAQVFISQIGTAQIGAREVRTGEVGTPDFKQRGVGRFMQDSHGAVLWGRVDLISGSDTAGPPRGGFDLRY